MENKGTNAHTTDYLGEKVLEEAKAVAEKVEQLLRQAEDEGLSVPDLATANDQATRLVEVLETAVEGVKDQTNTNKEEEKGEKPDPGVSEK